MQSSQIPGLPKYLKKYDLIDPAEEYITVEHTAQPPLPSKVPLTVHQHTSKLY